MAYKFQLGRARLSGSVIVEEGLQSDHATDISSSQDVYAEAHIRAGDEVSSVGDMEAGGQLRGLSDLYISSTSMQVGNAEFGGDVDVTGNVAAAGEFQGNLQYAISQGTGISAFSFDNSGAATVALDDSYAKGLLSVVDTNSIDMTYDNSAGEFKADLILASANALEVGASGLDLKSTIAGARTFSNDIDMSSNLTVVGAVDAAALSGTLEFKVSAGTGISMVDFSNDADQAVNIDTTWIDARIRSKVSVADTDSLDMHYDSATGEFSGSVILKSEAGGTISVDPNGLYIADSAISNAKLANSTISGKALGANLDSLSAAGAGALDMSSYNGSTAVNDLGVRVDSTSIVINASNQLELVDSHAMGLFSAADTNSIDLEYDGAGAFSGSVRLKTETGGTISVDADGLYIADSAIANAKLANSTISGKALGQDLSNMTVAAGSALSMDAYNGSAAVSNLAVQVDNTTISINGSNELEVSETWVEGRFTAGDTNSIDMHYSAGQFSADLILSGAASNDALEVTADGLNLKSTIAGSRTFSADVTIQGGLQVDGDLTYVNTTNLEIEDRLIRLAKGDVSYIDGAGFEFQWGDSFETAQVAFDSTAENAFDSSLPIQAPHMKAATFHGELIGASRMDVVSKTDGDSLEAGKVNKYTTSVAAGSSESVSLPASPEIGQKIMFKAGAISDSGSIEISGATGVVIDGVASILIESEYAAVTLVYTDTDSWNVF